MMMMMMIVIMIMMIMIMISVMIMMIMMLLAVEKLSNHFEAATHSFFSSKEAALPVAEGRERKAS